MRARVMSLVFLGAGIAFLVASVLAAFIGNGLLMENYNLAKTLFYLGLIDRHESFAGSLPDGLLLLLARWLSLLGAFNLMLAALSAWLWRRRKANLNG